MNETYDPPTLSPESHLTAEDVSQLNTLALVYLILGGLGMVLSLFTLVHIFLGLALITGNVEMNDAPPFIGWLFFCMGITFLVLGEAMSVAMILSSRHLKKRTNYMFSFVVACIACLSMPIGTILGIFTIIVMNRNTVKAAYGRT